MKILLINQPCNNRGDESAHKGLMRTLLKEMPDAEVKVLLDRAKEDAVEQMRVKHPRVEYLSYFIRPIHNGYVRVCHLAIKLDALWMCEPYPAFQRKKKSFQWADLILSAPGGMSMGGFQNWIHVFNLYIAKYLKKPLAYYGRSIGPFPTATRANRIFREASYRIMRYFSYFSLRDHKSIEIAKSMGINNVISVVDSAFLESPKVEIPRDVKMQIGGKPYFVFVPNLLIWHPAFKGRIERDVIIKFYCDALDVLFSVYPDCWAVMLPQTCCGSFNDNDINLFKEIAAKKNDGKEIVVSDQYSSDVQQSIIADAKLMVGSRYHSIVFALNNATPFVSLSYEHKMSGLLETLGKTDCMVNIEHVLETEEGRTDVLRQLKDRAQHAYRDEAAKIKAKQMARAGFDKFLKEYIPTIASK